jgi:hypothetical protein
MKALTPPRLLGASVALLFLLPSCQRNTEAKADPEWWKLETERIELVHQIELLDLRLSKQSAGDQGYSALKQEAAEGLAYRRELAAAKDELLVAVGHAREDLASVKSEWMRAARAAVVGREFAKLSGAAGRTYENAVITRISDVGVEFRHATGTARLAAQELTAAQLDDFGLDAEIASEAIRAEQESAVAYESWVDERVAWADTTRKEEEEAQQIALASVAPARPAPPESDVSSSTWSRTRLNDAPRSVGRGNTTWYPSYSYSYRYRPSYVRRYVPSRSYIYDPYSSGLPSYRGSGRSATFQARPSGCNAPVISLPQRSFIANP